MPITILLLSNCGYLRMKYKRYFFSVNLTCIMIFRAATRVVEAYIVIKLLAPNYLININIRFFFWPRGQRKNNY